MSADTDNLIESLASDLQEVKLIAHPFKRTLLWLVFALAYLGIAIYYVGIRWDFSDKIYDVPFVLEMIVVGLMSVSAAFCSLWLCVPDMRGQKWMLMIPSTLFGVFIVWFSTKVLLYMSEMPALEWHHCAQDAVFYGIFPVLGLFLLVGKGKTTCPKMMSFMNALAVSGLGYIGLRITCSAEDMGHTFVYHFMPFVVLSFLIVLAGRKIYRW